MARPEVKEEEKKGVEEEKLLDKEDAADLTILQ
jgi:hypothetical protein